MTMQANRLEDYEEAIESLLGEIREYQAVNSTLRGMAANLGQIQEVNAAAGKSMWSVAADASQTLSTIRGFHLDEMEARISGTYAEHQQALERLSAMVQSSVQEQQRMGLEVLQHTTRSQQDFAGFVKHLERMESEATSRELRIQAQVTALSESIHLVTGNLDRHVTRLERIVLAAFALVLLVIVAVSLF